MTETDKYGFKKVREGGWWVVLNNYKTSGMKITLTLKQSPKGRKRKVLIYSGVIETLHWDDMDEYVSIRDDKRKVHKFMVEDLYRLEPYIKQEGDKHESDEND